MNKLVADLAAWSLEHAFAGKAPTQGFKGEAFEKGTYRAAMAGKELAGGFKKHGSQEVHVDSPFAEILFLCSM